MKTLKTTTTIIALIIAFNTYAQIAPQGKKTLKVKEMCEQEYWQDITTVGLGPMLVDWAYKSLPKKLKKYGFNDITVKKFGIVKNTDNKYQVNVIDNSTGKLFKIRLSMLTKKPKYIIKETKADYSDLMEYNIDAFTDKKTYSSPILAPIHFRKVKNGDKVTTYMRISTVGITSNVGKKGVIILLNDKSKIKKPEADIDIRVNQNGSGYIYSAFFSLTKEEIEQLTQKEITAFRLYIYDKFLTESDAFKYKEYLKCIRKFKL